jgi:hypothetical protein
MAKKRRHSSKWDRCVRKVKRRGGTARNPYAICSRAKRRNPRIVFRHVLYAKAATGPVLKYVGGLKFARRGAPVHFATKSHAEAIGRQLKSRFPVLGRFKLWAA